MDNIVKRHRNQKIDGEKNVKTEQMMEGWNEKKVTILLDMKIYKSI